MISRLCTGRTQNQNANAFSQLDTNTVSSFPTALTVLQSSTFLTELEEAQGKGDHIQQLIDIK